MAAQFTTLANSQLALNPAPDLGFNNQSFTTTGWIRFDSVSGYSGVWGQGDSAAIRHFRPEWVLFGHSGAILFYVSDGTNSGRTIIGGLAVDTWYFIAAWYDAVAGAINISVNNGTPRSTSSPGPTSRGNGFSIGQTLGSFLAGRVQGVGVWDRVLTSAELTASTTRATVCGCPSARQVLAQYAYLGLGTPVQVEDSQPQVEYNLAVASGANHCAGLDDFGRVVASAWQDISGTPADLVRLNYGYDQASSRLWRQDVVAGSANLDELYGYDGLYRLNEMSEGIWRMAGLASPAT